jgi:hypothetical protein
VERKAENILFPTVTPLSGETNVDSISLCRTYFQIVEPTLVSINKRVSVRVFERECSWHSFCNNGIFP